MKTKTKILSTAGLLLLSLNISNGYCADPVSQRMIYGPTALPSGSKAQFSAYDLGFWQVDGAVSKNLDLGVQFTLPIGMLAFAPTARVHTEVGNNFHVGLFATGGIMNFFLLDDVDSDNATVGFYGAGPVASYQGNRIVLNASVLTYGAPTHTKDVAVLPSIGIRGQVSDHVSLNLEVFSLNVPSETEWGKNWAILYGIRMFGDKGGVFGEISFLAPITDGVSGLYKTIPMGIPILTVGYAF